MMTIRNCRFNQYGTIDLEYDHPTFGWIPFTASPAEAEIYALALAGDVTPYTPPSTEELRAGLPPLSARQLRLGLIANGIMPSQVQVTIEAMPAGPDRETALVEWEYASSFERLHPLIAAVAAALGLTDEQVDAMWATASAI